MSAGFGGRQYDATPSSSVYIGNLFFDVREDDLRKKFEGCGTIESVKLIMDNRGLSKGYVLSLPLPFPLIMPSERKKKQPTPFQAPYTYLLQPLHPPT